MSFTYYGDLLGISGYYKLNAKTAYNRLNDFYNTTHSCLYPYCSIHDDVQVNLFSDSLLIWGDNEEEIFSQLQKLYIKLVDKGLLLRGAIVSGKLQFEPRITLTSNITKSLPKDDTLARAAGLEKMQQGARFLIESSLVERVHFLNESWLTHDGYINNIKPHAQGTVRKTGSEHGNF